MEFLNYIFTQELDKVIATTIFIAGIITYIIVEYRLEE